MVTVVRIDAPISASIVAQYDAGYDAQLILHIKSAICLRLKAL
jgi:hypothetical protein